LALKTYRPTSPGRRGMVSASFEEITKTVPEKSLLLPLPASIKLAAPPLNAPPSASAMGWP